MSLLYIIFVIILVLILIFLVRSILHLREEYLGNKKIEEIQQEFKEYLDDESNKKEKNQKVNDYYKNLFKNKEK